MIRLRHTFIAIAIFVVFASSAAGFFAYRALTDVEEVPVREVIFGAREVVTESAIEVEVVAEADVHFVGDIMLDRGVRKQIDAAGTTAYPWQGVGTLLEGHDLVIGNLEGTVNTQPSTYTYDAPFRFVFDPSYVEEMAKHIDVVSLANNHTRDVGYAGEVETREWLDEVGVGWFGSWDTPAPRYDADVSGIAMTFIGYHQFQPDEETLRDEITTAHEEGRFVIVMPHWGEEYVNAPGAGQRRLAQLMVDAGADLIVGGHAHVPQGVEVIDGVPVFYSLGNFVFDQEIPVTWNTFTLSLTITHDAMTFTLHPIYVRYGKPTPIDGDAAQAVLDLVASVSDVGLREGIGEGVLRVER